MPGRAVSGRADAGVVVRIHPVDRQCFPNTDNYKWCFNLSEADVVTQNTTGVRGRAEAGNRFGAAVSALHNRRLCDSLVVSAPGDDIGRVRSAGAVIVARKTLQAGASPR